MVHKLITPRPTEISPQSPPVLDDERERLHRQMMSSVSHDLKTPLASIIGALEVFERMKDKLSVEKQATLVNVALQEAYRLDNFITNILDMARLENHMVKANQESIEVGAIIRDCIMRMNTRLRDSTIDFPQFDDLVTTTDPVLLSRAICLVLDNAVKYGGSPATVRIEYGKDNMSTGYIRVHDNGAGIPDGRKEAIFSKYTRFVNEDQQNAGTGLGLSISRAIMRLLHGDITAANDLEGGATFMLHFPIQ